MTTATGRRALDAPHDRADSTRWRLASCLLLAGLVVLAIVPQKQLPDVQIHPTGPLPAVNIP